MQLSRYLKTFTYPADPDYLLLYSTRKSSLALLPREDFVRLEQGEIIEECQESLVGLGMLVDDLEREKQQVLNMISEINQLDPGVNVSVILGLACNFNCTYCYEGSQKSARAMQGTTVARLVDFLKTRLTKAGKEKLVLDFYGGEPLLYVEIIKSICAPLKEFCQGQGIQFNFSLTTNGSLLSRETVKELLPYGLYGAKVTVDGPPSLHNVMRPFKNGAPSFDTIIANLKECCDLVKIGFGGNYTSDNYIKIPELLEIAEQEGLTPERLGNVQFHPVIQTGDKFANPEFTGGCVSVNEPWLVEAARLVRQETLKRGYKTPKMAPSLCMVDLDDALTINHDGGIYKCVAMIGHQQYRVGDIWSGIKDFSDSHCLGHWQKEERCRDCVYLPLCFGGCRYMEFQRSGNMEKVDCQKEFLDATLEEMLLQDVSYSYQ